MNGFGYNSEKDKIGYFENGDYIEQTDKIISYDHEVDYIADKINFSEYTIEVNEQIEHQLKFKT